MPKIYRGMKVDSDGLPVVSPTAWALGVRPNVDIEVDSENNVLLSGSGMSVAPSIRDLPPHRVPERLRHVRPGASGSEDYCCFSHGEGLFQEGAVAANLKLHLDKKRKNHGTVAPANQVRIEQFQRDLALTRGDWRVEE